MKRFAALLLAVVFCIGGVGLAGPVYDGEILFRGIPWGSSIDEYREGLVVAGIDADTHRVLRGGVITNFGGTRLEDRFGYVSLKEGGYYVDINGTPDLYVAGYEVHDIRALFMCYVSDGAVDVLQKNAKLINAEYILDIGEFSRDEAFEDLKRKLTEQYGDPAVEMTLEIEGVPVQHYVFVDWFGASDTAVSLRKTWYTTDGVRPTRPTYGQADQYVCIEYGLTDTTENINDVNQYFDLIAQQEESALRARVAQDNSGL